MPRVFLISHGFQGEYEVGFANGLSRNGVAVTLIGADRTPSDRLDPEVEFLNLRGDQSEKRALLQKMRNMLRYWFEYGRFGLHHRSGIFHFIGMFSIRSGFGVLAEAIYARAVFHNWILTVHNVLPHDAESRVNRLVHSIAYRMADVLVAHTTRVAQILRQDYGIAPNRIIVVEHGIDRFVEPTCSARPSICAKLGIPADGPLLLFFGNVWKFKGVDLLLESFGRADLAPNVRLLIVGKPSSDAYRREIEGLIARSPASHSIHWYSGYLPEEDVPDLLGGVDAIVLPYRRIDQSGVMFSAKSAGLPILATDVGSFANYMDTGRDVLVPPDDVDALAEGLRQLISSLRAGDRVEAIRKARRFDWQETLKQYARLIAEQRWRRPCSR